MFQCKELQDPCLGREWEGSSRRWQKPRSEAPGFSHPCSYASSWLNGEGDPLREARAVASQSRPLAVEQVTCPQQPSLAGTSPSQRAPRVSSAISAQLPHQPPGSPERSLWQRWPQHSAACQGSFLLSPDTNPFPFSLRGHMPQVIRHSLP